MQSVQSVPITTKCCEAWILAHDTVVLDTTLCDKVYQWLAAGLWFSPGTPVSSTNKTDPHDITEILLKVVIKHHKSKPNPLIKKRLSTQSAIQESGVKHQIT